MALAVIVPTSTPPISPGPPVAALEQAQLDEAIAVSAAEEAAAVVAVMTAMAAMMINQETVT